MKTATVTDKEVANWQSMMRSIRKAACILGINLTENETPEYLDWNAGRFLHDRLWATVKYRDKN